MAEYTVDKVLGVGESTDGIILFGSCSVVLQGITEGAVNLEYLLPKTAELTTPAWTLHTAYTADGFSTITVAGDQTKFRLTGSSNNADVYAKIIRG